MVLQRLRQYFRSDYQPGERLLVQKIDFFILTFCCLSYFTNYVSNHWPPERALQILTGANAILGTSEPPGSKPYLPTEP